MTKFYALSVGLAFGLLFSHPGEAVLIFVLAAFGTMFNANV